MTPVMEGQTLGKYRVLEALGKGGMARVYRAYHPQLDRYVAIKVLRPDLVEEEEFLVRFRREAQAVAALRHPNIVQVFDFDVEGDIYYLVMELLEGDTLKARLNDYRLRGERMPLGETVRVLLDVLDGLAYAHSEGMIHRDIKPANILLNKRGQAVIADFGLAQIVGGTRYTVSGALMGTLNYMAPEQGLESHSDARSDIYSLGIVFYEMLTQRTPFDADTPLAILMKHLNDPLPLPRKIAPDIPEPFERVVLKALAKQPEQRYQSAAEMAQALHQAAEEVGIELPARISLPLSFTTPEAPSESVAVLSGSVRGKITDAQFAQDDTDESLGKRLAAAGGAEPQSLKTAGKDLLGAVGAMAQMAMNVTTRELHKATRSAGGGPPAQTSPDGALSAVEGADAAPSQQLAGEGVQSFRQAGKDLFSAAGAVAQVAMSATTKELRQATRSAEGEPSAQAAGDGLQFAESDQSYEKPARRKNVRIILAGVGFLVLGNLAAVWIGGLTGHWSIFGRGWPIELFMVGVLLCAIMYATSTIWLLIPAGIVLGNALLLSYTSLTNWWWQWAFLWPLELITVGGSIALPILLSSRRESSQRLSRVIALALILLSVLCCDVVGLTASVL